MNSFKHYLEAKNVIEDSIDSKDGNPKMITLPGIDRQVAVHETSKSITSKFITIDHLSWYRWDKKNLAPKVSPDAWNKKLVERLQNGELDIVCYSTGSTFANWILSLQRTELIKYLNNSTIDDDASANNNAKLSRRVVVKGGDGVNSLLTILVQIVPLLIESIPLTLVSTPKDAPLVSYLRYQLVLAGLPIDMFTHLIDSGVEDIESNDSNCFFVLTETGDIDAVYDQLVKCYFATNRTSIKLFVHEALKAKVKKIVEFKQHNLMLVPTTTTTTTTKLNEKQSTSDGDSNIPPIDLDSVDFECPQQDGVKVFYYRTYDELLKMTNHLQQCAKLRTDLISIWSTNVPLVYKIVKQLVSSQAASVWINRFPLLSVTTNKSASTFDVIQCAQLLKTFNIEQLPQSSSWPRLSSSERAALLKKCRAASPFILNRSIDYEAEEYPGDNILNLRHFQPIGQIILKLSVVDDKPEHSIWLQMLVFNALLAGNNLVLLGATEQLKPWHELTTTLPLNAVQLIETTTPTPTTLNASCLQLTNEKESTTIGVYVDAQRCQENGTSGEKILRNLSRNVYISLPEFEMSKIVEK